MALLPSVTFSQDVRAICRQIDGLNDRILSGEIKKQDAKIQLLGLIVQLKTVVPVAGNASWTFPLQGYRLSAVGGSRGNGYYDKGYNFFDGNKHTAHPAHDIFINDRDQNDIDDKTKQPVNVLALADGVVLACKNEWENGSDLRGGKFIWIYHPKLEMISYYAHNREVLVQPGDMVTSGQKIAEVGRTGLNAFKKRSPTHLHFGTYRLVDGVPVPFNGYQQFVKTRYL
ncbi:M23 family metallopeptidase [Mucilaginibacter myungsuensis]|uniref:M23 family metallopeptidase n=1 Tax=Mucilaginibacter myungsuensis TaxID=649104 RepID=A0A929PWB3_9SPHI|nr:M23 family metallopeptidase [Mucilaginibacter myungsuensis]MBE9660997.1 M23 family metallopeptidase [Mucilaginibacter myungsuensis]MDN3601043.1 M23 family metallopeptidase [Mucilaginibacter myungsuensis]